MKPYNALYPCISPWPYRGGNPLVMLCLVDRTPVEVE
jgi:hypothetical protein